MKQTKAEKREEARRDLYMVFVIVAGWISVAMGGYFYPLYTACALVGLVLIMFARWVVRTAWAAFGPFGDEDEENNH
jgi:hypothetical protein